MRSLSSVLGGKAYMYRMDVTIWPWADEVALRKATFAYSMGPPALRAASIQESSSKSM